MTAPEFEARLIAWARRRPDVAALVQIGSRAQAGGLVDRWSDWDFHLITTNPENFHRPDWLAEIAPVWTAHVERSPRGALKVSAILDGAIEADFVPLASWQMQLVYWGMRRPAWAGWMPRRLVEGIQETRTILLNSGYKVLVGGEVWEKRMAAVAVAWPAQRMSEETFRRHTAAFWQKAVWVAKKIARPEPRSAHHWLHKLVVEHVYALLEEEAWLAGRPARPEAQKAERWLDENRLRQTAMATSLEPAVLARALLGQLTLFREVSEAVAQARGFAKPDYAAVEAWLRTELEPLAR